jgi:outer membrane protein assembly factor BamB
MLGFFKKYSLKYGPGSVGETTREISKVYNLYINQRLQHRGALNKCFEHRIEINRIVPERGDNMVFHSKFRDFNNWVKDGDYHVKNDLAVFVFQVLFFSSSEFRSNFKNIDRDDKSLILEVIHSTAKKTAPNGVTISFDTFRKTILKLTSFWMFNQNRLSEPLVDYSIGVEHKSQVLDVNLGGYQMLINWQTENSSRRGFFKTLEGKGDNLYFASGDASFSNNHFYALNLKSGKFEWSFEMNNKIACQPVILSDSIFLYLRSGMMVKLDLKGNQLWSFKLTQSVEEANLKDGSILFHHKPIGFNGDIIIAGLDKNLFRISSQTGEIIWKMELSQYIQSNLHIEQKNLIFHDASGGVFSLNCENNEFNWKTRISENEGYFKGKSYVIENSLILASNEFVYSISILNGKINWREKTNRISQTIEKVKDGVCYITGSPVNNGPYHLICKDSINNKVKWQLNMFSDISIEGRYNHYLIVHCYEDGYYYLINENNGNSLGNFFLNTGSNPYCTNEQLIFSVSHLGAHITSFSFRKN